MPDEPLDGVVDHSGVPIAVRDFGGPGVGIVLLHGLSRTLADWNVVAPQLAARHRVVAMDIRGHGRSGDGPWSWDTAVADVEAVAKHFEMRSPAVMGHSLGGMIAAMWGRDHPESAGVINLDGHGNPRPDQYVGLDQKWVSERRAELDAMQRQQIAALCGPLSEVQIEALTSQQKNVANQLRAPEKVFVEGLRRALEARDGAWYLRPAPDGLGKEIYESLDEIDMFGIYRSVRCPLLLFNAADPPSGREAPLGLAWIAELTAAFRKGQTRDLRALASAQSNLRVETVVGSHGLLFEQSETIVSTSLSFLEGQVGPLRI